MLRKFLCLVLLLLFCLSFAGCSMVQTDTAGYSNGIPLSAFCNVVDTYGDGYYMSESVPLNEHILSSASAYNDCGSTNIVWYKCSDVSSAKAFYEANKCGSNLLGGSQQKIEFCNFDYYKMAYQSGDTVILATGSSFERDAIYNLVSQFDLK